MTDKTRQEFEQLALELRPMLHRYCARMTGSVIDGEDVLQDALLKAFAAYPRQEPITNAKAWLFRIAHNASQDFLRRRARAEALYSQEGLELMIEPTPNEIERHVATTASLATFMELPVMQRSAVILMDVLGYSLLEISDITDKTVPTVKAALHRGRTKLRQLAETADIRPTPSLDRAEQKLLTAYIDRFNARDFDSIRDMLAEEVRLELVAKSLVRGRSEVNNYFGNYSRVQDWSLTAGFIDRKPAILVCDHLGELSYFILLEWIGNTVSSIRDFRHARYALDGADASR